MAEDIAENPAEEPRTIPAEAQPRRPWPVRVWRFYVDGFKSMTVGRYLWALIIAKLIIFFLVFRLIFFPNLLNTNYDTDEERAQAVRSDLLNR